MAGPSASGTPARKRRKTPDTRSAGRAGKRTRKAAGQELRQNEWSTPQLASTLCGSDDEGGDPRIRGDDAMPPPPQSIPAAHTDDPEQLPGSAMPPAAAQAPPAAGGGRQARRPPDSSVERVPETPAEHVQQQEPPASAQHCPVISAPEPPARHDHSGVRGQPAAPSASAAAGLAGGLAPSEPSLHYAPAAAPPAGAAADPAPAAPPPPAPAPVTSQQAAAVATTSAASGGNQDDSICTQGSSGDRGSGRGAASRRRLGMSRVRLPGASQLGPAAVACTTAASRKPLQLHSASAVPHQAAAAPTLAASPRRPRRGSGSRGSGSAASAAYPLDGPMAPVVTAATEAAAAAAHSAQPLATKVEAWQGQSMVAAVGAGAAAALSTAPCLPAPAWVTPAGDANALPKDVDVVPATAATALAQAPTSGPGSRGGASASSTPYGSDFLRDLDFVERRVAAQQPFGGQQSEQACAAPAAPPAAGPTALDVQAVRQTALPAAAMPSHNAAPLAAVPAAAPSVPDAGFAFQAPSRAAVAAHNNTPRVALSGAKAAAPSVPGSSPGWEDTQFLHGVAAAEAAAMAQAQGQPQAPAAAGAAATAAAAAGGHHAAGSAAAPGLAQGCLPMLSPLPIRQLDFAAGPAARTAPAGSFTTAAELYGSMPNLQPYAAPSHQHQPYAAPDRPAAPPQPGPKPGGSIAVPRFSAPPPPLPPPPPQGRPPSSYPPPYGATAAAASATSSSGPHSIPAMWMPGPQADAARGTGGHAQQQQTWQQAWQQQRAPAEQGQQQQPAVSRLPTTVTTPPIADALMASEAAAPQPAPAPAAPAEAAPVGASAPAAAATAAAAAAATDEIEEAGDDSEDEGGDLPAYPSQATQHAAAQMQLSRAQTQVQRQLALSSQGHVSPAPGRHSPGNRGHAQGYSPRRALVVPPIDALLATPASSAKPPLAAGSGPQQHPAGARVGGQSDALAQLQDARAALAEAPAGPASMSTPPAAQQQADAAAGTAATPGSASAGGRQPASSGAAVSPGGPAAAASPSVSQLSLQLESYLPEELCRVYRSHGFRGQLYQWQAECLTQGLAQNGQAAAERGPLAGRNLVFSAPTSGGKSLVAEIICLRRLITTKRPFLLVLPFRALCLEKATHLEALLAPLGLACKSCYGGRYDRKLLSSDTGAIVCTPEMGNRLVNDWLEDDCLGELGACVVDELHMVGDEDRGYLLELLLTKLSYANKAVEAAPSYNPASQGLQIIGMSATMPNGQAVAQWLGAALYQTSFRPVPLLQMLKVGRQLRDEQGRVVRQLAPPQEWERADPQHLGWLCHETISQGHSVLIFCHSKDNAAYTARSMAKLVQQGLLQVPERARPPGGGGGGAATAGGGTNVKTPSGPLSRQAVADELRSHSHPATATTAGLLDLAGLVEHGVAFHHSVLSHEERELVEGAFRCGAISILCATSTLAAGVNLPARRVIFLQPYMGLAPSNGGQLLDATKYRQMSGRAGRAGIDDMGESILMECPRVPLADLQKLISCGATEVCSCLEEGKRGMKRAVLEVVATGAVKSAEDVRTFALCTLLAVQKGAAEGVYRATVQALTWLRQQRMLEWKQPGLWSSTALGRATLASGMPPELALAVLADLERARQGLVLASDLHLTYLITPVNEELDMSKEQWSRLDEVAQKIQEEKNADCKVAQAVGISFKLIQELCLGQKSAKRIMTAAAETTAAAAATSEAAAGTAAAAAAAESGGGNAGAGRQSGAGGSSKGGSCGGNEAKWKAAQEQGQALRRVIRFYLALILHDLMQEQPLDAVVERYGLNRVTARAWLQGLQERAAKSASMVASFCERMSWPDMEALVTKFQSRVFYGVKPELVELMEIPQVKLHRARLLYKSGLRTAEAVAAASVDAIVEILGKSAAGSGHNPAGDRRAARQMVEGAKQLLTARCKDLQKQAEAVLAALGPKGSQPAATLSATQGGGRASQPGQLRLPAMKRVGSEMSPQAAVRQQPAMAPGPSVPAPFADGPDTQPLPHHGQQAEPAGQQGTELPAAESPSKRRRVMAPLQQPAQPHAAQPLAASPFKPSSAPAAAASQPPASSGWQVRAMLSRHRQGGGGQLQALPSMLPVPPGQLPLGAAAAGAVPTAAPPLGAPPSACAAALPASLALWAALLPVLQPGWQPPKGAMQVTDPALLAQLCAWLRAKGRFAFMLQMAEKEPSASSSNAPLSRVQLPTNALGRAALQLPAPTSSTAPLDAEARQQAAAAAQAALLQDLKAGLKTLPDIEGIALSAEDGAAYYVPLPPPGAGTSYQSLAPLLQLMADGGVMKVTCDLKTQLASWCLGRRLALDDSCCVDVRIAAWLLQPDSALVKDSASVGTGRTRKQSDVKRLEDLIKPHTKGGGHEATMAAALSGLQNNLPQVTSAGPTAAAMHPAPKALSLRVLESMRQAALARKLFELQRERLEAEEQMAPLVKREMPLVKVLAAMERCGMGCDPAVLVRERATLERRLRQLEAQARDAVSRDYKSYKALDIKHTLNLDSNPFVSKLLFQDLGLPPPPTSEGKTHLSTRKEVLEEMVGQHPVVELIMEHRTISKLRSFLDEGCEESIARYARDELTAMEAAIAAAGGGGGQPGSALEQPVRRPLPRLHACIMQTNTDSGRLAMDEPSLQTVPKPLEFTVDDSQAQAEALSQAGSGQQQNQADGQQQHAAPGNAEADRRRAAVPPGKYGSNIRSAFVAPPGCVMLSADYQQMELRLMAHFSGDKDLVTMLNDPGRDPFMLLATKWLGKAAPSQEERNHAKQLAYGLIFGMGTTTLATKLGTDVATAETMHRQFLDSLPGLQAWVQATKKGCRECGYVRTVAGRRRPLPDINNYGKDGGAARHRAERQAVNTTVQGSAADLVKRVMVTMHGHLESPQLRSACRMVLMMHDELVFEVAADQLPEVAALVKAVMEGVAKLEGLQVPLPVKVKVGPSWGQLEEYALPAGTTA